MSETITKKQGRPSQPLTWPTGEFTAKDVSTLSKLTKVTVQLRINKALKNQEIEVSGKKMNSVGRPSIVYVKKV